MAPASLKELLTPCQRASKGPLVQPERALDFWLQSLFLYCPKKSKTMEQFTRPWSFSMMSRKITISYAFHWTKIHLHESINRTEFS